MEPELSRFLQIRRGRGSQPLAISITHSSFFLPKKRRAFCAVYAFMRYCDDVSDGNASLEDKRAILRDWRTRLDAALFRQLSKKSDIARLPGLRAGFSIPAEYFHWIIDGAEMDLDVAQYETFNDLYKYCFNVASAVGLVCLQIFGFEDERAKKYAEQCGIAFQLTNILRDVKEDAEMGRIYLAGRGPQAIQLHRGRDSTRSPGREIQKADEFRSGESAEEYYSASAQPSPAGGGNKQTRTVGYDRDLRENTRQNRAAPIRCIHDPIHLAGAKRLPSPASARHALFRQDSLIQDASMHEAAS